MTDPLPAPAYCDVYWTRPTADIDATWLSDSDAQRVARLRDPEDRHRSLTAAALLQLAVVTRLGTLAMPIIRECPRCDIAHGRPRIAADRAHLSVAHAHERVAVAISDCEVGIDVEHALPAAWDPMDVAEAISGPEELLSDAEEFYRTWVRKEALVKATGEGLNRPLCEIAVTGSRSAPRVLRYEGLDPTAVTLVDLDLGDRYPGAVALLTRDAPEIVVIHVDDRRLMAPFQPQAVRSGRSSNQRIPFPLQDR
jgi:4'-phosphopantetheinyl transferase